MHNSQHLLLLLFGTYPTTLMNTLIVVTWIVDKIFIRAPKITRKVTTTSIWICYPSRTNRMFYIIGEVAISTLDIIFSFI